MLLLKLYITIFLFAHANGGSEKEDVLRGLNLAFSVAQRLVAFGDHMGLIWHM